MNWTQLKENIKRNLNEFTDSESTIIICELEFSKQNR